MYINKHYTLIAIRFFLYSNTGDSQAQCCSGRLEVYIIVILVIVEFSAVI